MSKFIVALILFFMTQVYGANIQQKDSIDVVANVLTKKFCGDLNGRFNQSDVRNALVRLKYDNYFKYKFFKEIAIKSPSHSTEQALTKDSSEKSKEEHVSVLLLNILDTYVHQKDPFKELRNALYKKFFGEISGKFCQQEVYDALVWLKHNEVSAYEKIKQEAEAKLNPDEPLLTIRKGSEEPQPPIANFFIKILSAYAEHTKMLEEKAVKKSEANKIIEKQQTKKMKCKRICAMVTAALFMPLAWVIKHKVVE